MSLVAGISRSDQGSFPRQYMRFYDEGSGTRAHFMMNKVALGHIL